MQERIRKIFRASISFSIVCSTTFFAATSAEAQKPLGQKQVVVRRDNTQASGCMFGEEGKTPVPCPANTVRQTMVVSEAEATSRGEMFVRLESEADYQKAAQQLFQKIDRSQPITLNEQSIRPGGSKVLLKPMAQGCGGINNRLYFYQNFSPSTLIKFTVPYFKEYGGGGCNMRTPINLIAELQSGPNVYIENVAWSPYSQPGAYWTGSACRLMNTSVTFPNSPGVFWNVNTGKISVSMRQGGCAVWNTVRYADFNLP